MGASFRFNTNTNTRATNNNRGPANDAWKAAGFINFRLETGDGRQPQLGKTGIPLRLSVPSEKAIFDYLNSAPTAMAALMSAMVFSYSATSTTSGLQLPGMDSNAQRSTDDLETLGYINVYLPTEDGEQAQLGFIKLRASSLIEQDLAAFLASKGDVALTWVVNRLVASLHVLGTSKKQGFKLPSLIAPAPTPAPEQQPKDMAAQPPF